MVVSSLGAGNRTGVLWKEQPVGLTTEPSLHPAPLLFISILLGQMEVGKTSVFLLIAVVVKEQQNTICAVAYRPLHTQEFRGPQIVSGKANPLRGARIP